MEISTFGSGPPLEVEKNKVIFSESRPFFEHFLKKVYFHHSKICVFRLLWCETSFSHWLHLYLIPSCIDILCFLRLTWCAALYSHRLHSYLIPSCILVKWDFQLQIFPVLNGWKLVIQVGKTSKCYEFWQFLRDKVCFWGGVNGDYCCFQIVFDKFFDLRC